MSVFKKIRRRFGLFSQRHTAADVGEVDKKAEEDASKPDGNHSSNDRHIDHIDAPLLKAVEARIPNGDTYLIAPSFQSVRENEPFEQIHLGRALVTGGVGRVYQRGIWLMQFSWYAGQTFLAPSYQIPPIPDFNYPENQQAQYKTITIAGRGTSTVCAFKTVYGHVLLDELPLLLFLLEGQAYKKYDAILCSAMAITLLKRITGPGIEDLAARLTPAEDHAAYDFEDFTALLRSGCRMNPSGSELDILRKTALLQDDPCQKNFKPRFFLKRASATRSIINQADIELILNKYSIDSICPAEIGNPWGLFAAAQLVIGVSGSDLSDSAFMGKGSVLLEIHPSDHIKPYNWNVARKLEVEYLSMLADSSTLRRTPIGPGNSPITVDPVLFEIRLREAITACNSATV